MTCGNSGPRGATAGIVDWVNDGLAASKRNLKSQTLISFFISCNFKTIRGLRGLDL